LLSRVVCFAPESGRIDGALRLIRRIVNEVLAVLDGEFGKLYAAEGRPSIAPERLLRALLLQAFYTSVRSAS
jgi:transposase